MNLDDPFHTGTGVVVDNNYFTLTNLKEMDPEYTTAGISSYPFYKSVMLGVKLTF